MIMIKIQGKSYYTGEPMHYIKYHLKRRRFVSHFIATYVQPVTQQYVLNKNLCNQSNHYENYKWKP